VIIGLLCGFAIARRMFDADGLAEGERLYSNILLQDFARFRAGSLREELNPPSGLTEGYEAEIWVSFWKLAWSQLRSFVALSRQPKVARQ
jgi:hypothetical protein